MLTWPFGSINVIYMDGRIFFEFQPLIFDTRKMHARTTDHSQSPQRKRTRGVHKIGRNKNGKKIIDVVRRLDAKSITACILRLFPTDLKISHSFVKNRRSERSA